MGENELLPRLNRLEKEVRELIATFAGIKIDLQLMVKGKERIKPGTGCKVYYDSNGLIMKSSDLEAGDIPSLPMEKVDGLLERLNKQAEDQKKGKFEEKKIKSGTGIKISYDEYGRVTSSTNNLLQDDIPELPMERIFGLEDTIRNIRNELNGILSTRKDRYRVAPGTYTKITYGDDGRVISGTNISMDDIPMNLINRIIAIESRIGSLAAQDTMNSVVRRVDKKLNANPEIYPGTYTKVYVDEHGLVTQGDRITIDDIGPITINNVADLQSILKNKANQSDMIQVMNTVNQLASSDKSREIVQLKNEVSTKANDYTVRTMETKLNMISSSVDTLLNRMPDKNVMELINSLVQSNEDMKRRIASFEREINDKIEKLKK